MTEPTLPPEPAKDATADEIEADIAATRQQLGETIDALEEKLDVSAQAKRRVDQTKSQLAAKVNDTRSQLTSKVDTVRTQVADRVGQAKVQVTDKVAETRAKVTRKPDAATSGPVDDGGHGVDSVYPAELGADDSSSPGSTQVTFTGSAGRTRAVTDQVKNISTRLANKVTEVRTRTNAPGSDDGGFARRARAADGDDPTTGKSTTSTTSTGSTTSAFTNPRRTLPAAAAVVLAGVVCVWLTRRVLSRPDPAVQRA